LLGLIKKFNAESLFRNSAFLFVQLLLTTACGFGTLTLLTHIFTVQAFGLSGTAVSACVLAASLTQFGLPNSLPRFLPTARRRAALVNTGFTTVLLSTAIVAVVFLALPYAKSFFALGGWVFGAVFVLAACVLAAETFLGTVLVADRAADKMAVASIAPNLLGAAAPIVLVAVGNLGAFIARVVSDIGNCVIYSRLIARRGHRFRLQLDFSGTRQLVAFSGGMYLASIVGSLPQLLLPLTVFARVGVKGAAYWAIAMSIATFLFQMPSLVSRALLPEVSQEAADRRYLVRRSALLTAAIAPPTLAVLFFLAPIGISIFFGRNYATGVVEPLRWLIVAALISAPLSALGTILVLAKKSLIITFVNFVDAAIVLGLVLLWARAVNQVAIAWTIGEVGNDVLFGLFAFLALHEVGWRWEDLGGTQARREDTPLSRTVTATGQLRALGKLVIIA
jgi:O-antigen/teichoic acid export membrane protein